uniref:Interferon-induced protein with tetratricopeptide repeats 1-like n=1 Tax=Neogobius melanostomus TaxID=47308 RepID=A0A8C6WUH8_9GOBI
MLHLEALQCHFTWGLSSNHVTLLKLQNELLDICPDESNPWRGHIYNLLGFLQTRLGHADEALIYFSSASEALRGPELLVNYSDLAWLHYERGEPDRSKEYLDHTTERDHPSERHHTTETERDHPTDPSEELLLPEVLAEKAWTLMKFGPQKLEATELFERALEEQPERVEWRSSQAIALMSAHRHHLTGVPPEVLLKVQRAHEEDPGNMYLSVEYLSQRVKRGEQVEEEEVAALMPRIIESAHSSYSGLRLALSYYSLTDALDVGIVWAEEALEKHPDSRYVKCCAALCYKWRVLFKKDGASKRHLVEKCVALLKEVISLYPDSCFRKEIDLAKVYALSNHSLADAELLYSELLLRDLEPTSKQILYNSYAKFLYFQMNDLYTSTQYHMMAAEIPVDSNCRSNSIQTLQKIKTRRDYDPGLRAQVDDFLLRTPEI